MKAVRRSTKSKPIRLGGPVTSPVIARMAAAMASCAGSGRVIALYLVGVVGRACAYLPESMFPVHGGGPSLAGAGYISSRAVIRLWIVGEALEFVPRWNGLIAGFHVEPGKVVDLALPVERLRLQPAKHVGVDVQCDRHALGRRCGAPLEAVIPVFVGPWSGFSAKTLPPEIAEKSKYLF